MFLRRTLAIYTPVQLPMLDKDQKRKVLACFDFHLSPNYVGTGGRGQALQQKMATTSFCNR